MKRLAIGLILIVLCGVYPPYIVYGADRARDKGPATDNSKDRFTVYNVEAPPTVWSSKSDHAKEKKFILLDTYTGKTWIIEEINENLGDDGRGEGGKIFKTELYWKPVNFEKSEVKNDSKYSVTPK